MKKLGTVFWAVSLLLTWAHQTNPAFIALAVVGVVDFVIEFVIKGETISQYLQAKWKRRDDYIIATVISAITLASGGDTTLVGVQMLITGHILLGNERYKKD